MTPASDDDHQFMASCEDERPGVRRIGVRPYHLIVASRSGPGDVTYRLESRVITRHIRVSGIFLLPADRSCEVTLHKPVRSFHLGLDRRLFWNAGEAGGDPSVSLAPILGGEDAVLQPLLVAMEEAVRGDCAGTSGLLTDLVATAIAARLVALNVRTRSGSCGGRCHGALGSGHLRKLREFVEANLAGEIRLNSLAELCGLSAGHFIRAFRSSTGVSPYQYVMGLRIGRAKTLLDDSSLTLAEIAQCCGFANAQHLSGTFRRLTGMAPGRFRSR